MIEQVGIGVAFYAFFVASKAGKTGLTVTCDVWRITEAGAATEVVTGGSATEIGDGVYRYALSAASVTAAGEYIAVFKTSDSSVDAQHIPAIWTVGHANIEMLDAAISSRNAVAPLDATATQAAAAAALTAYDPATGAEVAALPDALLDGEEVAAGVTVRAALAAAGAAGDPLRNAVPGSYASGSAGYALGRIASGALTVVSPILADGFLRLMGGDAYLAADGRRLDVRNDAWALLPDDAVLWRFGEIELAGLYIDAATVGLELSGAQSGALAVLRPGRGSYDIFVTRGAGVAERTITLVKAAPCLLEPQEAP